jgi:hypothetical protein
MSKPPTPLNYACHVCGILGHKLTNCPKFCKMKTMFKDKGGKTTKNKPIGKVKITNASVNMVDVHVTIQSKVKEE